MRRKNDDGSFTTVPHLSIINPWYYPSIGEYSSVVERRGIEVTYYLIVQQYEKMVVMVYN